MSRERAETRSEATGRSEIAGWSLLGALLEGFIFPGAGVVLGLVLGFSRLKNDPSVMRWLPTAIGVLALALHVAGLMTGAQGPGA